MFMKTNLDKTVDLFTFTKEILNGKLIFCAVIRDNAERKSAAVFVNVLVHTDSPCGRDKFNEQLK